MHYFAGTAVIFLSPDRFAIFLTPKMTPRYKTQGGCNRPSQNVEKLESERERERQRERKIERERERERERKNRELTGNGGS